MKTFSRFALKSLKMANRKEHYLSIYYAVQLLYEKAGRF